MIDIITQLQFTINGDERLADLTRSLQQSGQHVINLQQKLAGLKDALARADTYAQRRILRNEIRGVTAELEHANNAANKLGANLEKQTKSNQTSLGGMVQQLGALTGLPIGGGILAGLVAIGGAVVATSAKFEGFKAQLTNITGSGGVADQLIAKFTKFAAETPFQIDEIVGGYVKLRNLGVKPTISEMRNMGDIAAASGKSLNQFVEAFIDAQTGENERLKEFGIRAKKHGDMITYTFRGESTTIRQTQEEISKYLYSIGELNGIKGTSIAMAQSMTGKLSNLKDMFIRLAKVVGDIVSPAVKGFLDLTMWSLDKWVKMFELINKFSTDAGRLNEVLDATTGRYGASQAELVWIKDMNAFIDKIRELDTDTEEGRRGFALMIEDMQDNINRFTGDTRIKDWFTKQMKELQKEVNQIYVEEAAKRQDALDKRNEEIRQETEKTMQELAGLVVGWQRKIDAGRVGAMEEGEAKMKAAMELQKKEALQDLDARFAETKAKFKEKGMEVPAEVAAVFSKARSLINTYYKEALAQDLKAWEKQVKEKMDALRKEYEAWKVKTGEDIAAAEQAMLDRKAEANPDVALEAARKRRREAMAKADRDELKAKEDAAAMAKKLGQSAAEAEAEVAELYRIKRLDIAADFEDELSGISWRGIEERLAQIKRAGEYEEIAANKEHDKKMAKFRELSKEAALLLLLMQNPETSEEVKAKAKKLLEDLKLDLLKLQKDVENEQPAEPKTKDFRESAEWKRLQNVKSAWQELVPVIQMVNDAIVASEQKKVERLIQLQEQRVADANRIADEGNAEALERERQRLEDLQEQREKLAARQQRLSTIMQAANFALAASEAIVAIAKTAGQGGAAAPVLIPLVGAALATGTAFVLSLIKSFQKQSQQFAEGTDFVRGERGRDKIPAMLTYGERVVTAENNQRYGGVYDFIEKQQPHPATVMRALDWVNYPALAGQLITHQQEERTGIMTRALLDELNGVRGGIGRLLDSSRDKGVRITNVNELAKALADEERKWKL